MVGHTAFAYVLKDLETGSLIHYKESLLYLNPDSEIFSDTHEKG